MQIFTRFIFSAAASLGDRKNMAFMGTIVSTGSGILFNFTMIKLVVIITLGKGVVVAIGNSTELGKISVLLQKVHIIS